MLYYKLVRKRFYEDGVKLTSYVNNMWFPQQLITEYKIGQFVYPSLQAPKLFVFNSLEQACDYVDSDISICIFSCEVTNPEPVDYIGYPGDVDRFWRDISEANKEEGKENFSIYSRYTCHSMPAPNGTVAVDSVKLIKEVFL